MIRTSSKKCQKMAQDLGARFWREYDRFPCVRYQGVTYDFKTNTEAYDFMFEAYIRKCMEEATNETHRRLWESLLGENFF